MSGFAPVIVGVRIVVLRRIPQRRDRNQGRRLCLIERMRMALPQVVRPDFQRRAAFATGSAARNCDAAEGR